MLESLNAALKAPLIHINESSFITGKQILLALLLTIIAVIISRFLSRKVVGKVLQKTSLTEDSRIVVKRLIFFAILILNSLIILSFLGVPLTSFALFSGAIAIGLGFGARTIIENFLSGWILMTERPIRIGDVVEFEGRYGKIINIGNRATTIKRMDGAHIVIPNNQILESRLINLTITDPLIRTSVLVGVSYGSDVLLTKSLLQQVAVNHELVVDEPPPLVVFEDFGDNALTFELFFWVAIGSGKEFREIRSDVRFEIYRVFAENNIVVAFPQRDVHLYMQNQDDDKFSDLGVLK